MKPDPVSLELVSLLQMKDPKGAKLARLFRETFDQAYDGEHTGRYKPEQLSKTESAHIGSLVEINIRRTFDGFITDGLVMDYRIDGHEVDCKYSKHPFGWMIPNETLGHHAMVCHADDRKNLWRVGFVDIREEILTTGANRDQKRTIKAAGRSAIAWAWFDEPITPNTLLQLEPDVADQIMSPRSGQQRINRLFRYALGMRIPRGTVATVAMQKDYMKRLRYNGGARSALQPEGIVILGDYLYHQQLAVELDLPVPYDGDSVAVRLTHCTAHDIKNKVYLEGKYWAIADPEDPAEMAPRVSTTRPKSTVEQAIYNELPHIE